jgi:hypothetical protein
LSVALRSDGVIYFFEPGNGTSSENDMGAFSGVSFSDCSADSTGSASNEGNPAGQAVSAIRHTNLPEVG